MVRYAVFLTTFVLLLSACAAPSSTVQQQGPAGLMPSLSNEQLGPFPLAGTHQQIVWTFFNGHPGVQAETAALPLKPTSTVMQVNGNPTNLLAGASAMLLDVKGRLWVLGSGSAHNYNPGWALVFKWPLKTNSAPLLQITLLGTIDPDHLRFDASGNLWVTSHSNSTVFEYAGPFNTSGSLTPVTTLTNGISSPSGIAFDRSGTLYVANVTSNGSNSIVFFKAPITNNPSGYLDGLSGPGGLIFDRKGNLYASNNGPVGFDAVVRYNKSNLKNHAIPNIIDPTGLESKPYESDFAFDAKGNLYDADCGTAAAVFVYPTGSKRFSATLAPTAFRDANMQSLGCVWGIAIK